MRTQVDEWQRKKPRKQADFRRTLTPLLSGDEEIELAKQIERGGAEADKSIDRFIASNEGLVLNVAKRFLRDGIDIADLYAVGLFSVYKAAKKFEWQRGYKFSTLACRCLYRDMKRFVDETLRKPRTFSLNEMSDVEEKLQCPSSTLTSNEYKRFLERVIAEVLEQELSPMEREIIRRRFGFGARDGTKNGRYTLGQLAVIFNVTKEGVRYIQNRAFSKLKKHPAILELFEELSVSEQP